MPALAALSIAAAIFVLLIAYEGIRYREPRSFIRHGGMPTAGGYAERVRRGDGQLLVDRLPELDQPGGERRRLRLPSRASTASA